MSFWQAVDRLNERKIKHSGPKDRGFMDSIYFRDPLGLLIELASYRFDPPSGSTHSNVLTVAHMLRIKTGAAAIEACHVADAIEKITSESAQSLSNNSFPKN